MRALLVLAVLLVPLAGASPLLIPQQGDPDVPAAGAPVASVVAFSDERFQFTEGHRERAVAMPGVDYDRVVLTLTTRQDGDPWDRRFGVSIGGVEVLRGTTPRTTMTLSKDVSEHLALMPAGGEALVAVHLGSWVGKGILATVRLDFYSDEPVPAAAPHAASVPVARWAYMPGGLAAGADVTFGDIAPSKATLHFVTSGHGQAGEFWYLERPPAVARFRILVDGEEVAQATAMPYVYALVGFGGSSIVNDVLHTAVWWSAFRAADVAGAHVGVGEVSAYRVEVDAAQLGLFTGDRRVEVVQDTGAGTWVTSLAVLVDY